MYALELDDKGVMQSVTRRKGRVQTWLGRGDRVSMLIGASVSPRHPINQWRFDQMLVTAEATDKLQKFRDIEMLRVHVLPVCLKIDASGTSREQYDSPGLSFYGQPESRSVKTK